MEKTRDKLRHALGERIKELTALHETSKVFQNKNLSTDQALQAVLKLIPPAWQYPDITVASISYGGRVYRTEGFKETKWLQRADFKVSDGEKGSLEVYYLDEMPFESEGPFLLEERNLISSLAIMLQGYFEQRSAEASLKKYQLELEKLVEARTTALTNEIEERKRIESELLSYQKKLQSLTSQLSLAEERERHILATFLHDQVGQNLAMIKFKLRELQGNSIFCGFEGYLTEINELLDHTISGTRDLTLELSPPILYELGLEKAIEWLASKVGPKHRLKISVHSDKIRQTVNDDVRATLFKSVNELLLNVVKHAGAKKVKIDISHASGKIAIVIEDDGKGFDLKKLDDLIGESMGFGLFSIKERLKSLGGDFKIESDPGKGTRASLIIGV